MTINDPSPRPDPDPFAAVLQDLERRHLRRRLRTVENAAGPTATIDGRRVIVMASNDYLGLAAHPEVTRAAAEALARYGAGSGAARLVSGTLPPHVALEAELARFKGSEAALLFGSGYLANVGAIPALVRSGDLVVADRLCHASLIDGCRLSGASLRVFRHNDAGHLDAILRRRRAGGRVLVVTEGIFSMDGDAAPLPDLAAVTAEYGARLFLDDAHGTGVMGPQGRGTAAHYRVDAPHLVHMGTLGKALGAAGAYVAGSASLIDYLVNTARSFLYSTASPPATAAAAQAALTVLRAEPARLDRLWANRAYLHQALHAMGWRLTGTVSPILPVLLGSAEAALAVGRSLLEQGVFAPAIRPPTVPPGSSRIRLTVTSEHTRAHLDQVLAAFRQVGQRLRLLP